MIVYRVEHRRTRLGPWARPGAIQLYDQVSGHEPLQPMKNGPREEGGVFGERFEREGGVFGCLSLDQIVEWFPSRYGRLAMAEAGYVLAVYATFDVNEGRNSLVFPIGRSNRIGMLDLVTFKEEEPCRSRRAVPVKQSGRTSRK